MEDNPEREASAKVAQYLAVAVQVAEAVIRLRQVSTDQQAATHQQAAAAARAERTAQHTADRVVWSPALHRDWTATAGLTDLGRAWGAAAGWSDTDPTAETAATRVEQRLADLAPNAMTRFDELRAEGADRVAAMREVLTQVAYESQHGAAEPVVFVMGGGVAANDATATAADTFSAAALLDAQDHADGARRTAGPSGVQTATAEEPLATQRQVTYLVDLLARNPTGAGDRPTEPGELAQLTRGEASTYIQSLGGWRRMTDAGYPHPADVAADSYPHRLTTLTPATTGVNTETTAAAAAAGQTHTLTR